MRILRHKMTIIGLVLFLGMVGMVGEAAAQPSPNVFDGGNRWLITYYNDCDKAHSQWATQGICFLPYQPCGACGIMGAWYSDTFPDWNGRYMQEGDHLAMHADYAGNVGHDGMIIDLFAGTSPNDEGAGHWTEWREVPNFYGTTIGFGNTRIRRVGKCQLPKNNHISQMGQEDLEKLAAELSRAVKPRLRRDGKVAEFPIDPEQTPLPEEKQHK